MRVLTSPNEEGKLNILNSKNEFGFDIHDGFSTMSMTFEHGPCSLYGNEPLKILNLKLFSLAYIGSLKMVEDKEKSKKISTKILQIQHWTHSFPNHKVTKLSKH